MGSALTNFAIPGQERPSPRVGLGIFTIRQKRTITPCFGVWDTPTDCMLHMSVEFVEIECVDSCASVWVDMGVGNKE